MAKVPSTMKNPRFYTKVFGKTTESTAKDKNLIPWTNPILRAHLSKVKNKALVHKRGQTAAHTMVIGA